jgi:hypothetical protein
VLNFVPNKRNQAGINCQPDFLLVTFGTYIRHENDLAILQGLSAINKNRLIAMRGRKALSPPGDKYR